MPAPVKLHCSEALSRPFSGAEQMERAKVVMEASQRMPAVGFFGSRYGERWNVDIVALPHNAVRRQLYDAFVMTNALGKMVLDVPDADLARVYGWLGTLERFVDATLYAEQCFLYPIVDKTARKRKVELPEMLRPEGRASAKAQILELLSAARKTRDVSAGETGAKINALRYALDQFGANVLDYYSAMEKFLPKFFQEHLRAGEKLKDKIERKTVNQMSNEPQGSQLVVLLMQCIESRSKRSAFLQRHFKKERKRDSFKAEVRQVQATHMQLARVFDQTATKYERVFSVNTFMQHYGAGANEDEGTLQMLGHVEINEDGEMTVEVRQNVPTELLADMPDISDDHIYKTVNEEDEASSPRDFADVHVKRESDDDEYLEVDDDEHFIADIPAHTHGLRE